MCVQQRAQTDSLVPPFRLPTTVPGDRLGEALAHLELRSIVHTRNEFTAPWGLRMDWPPPIDALPAGVPLPATPLAVGFYIVTEGQCVLEMDHASAAVELVAGDMVLLPNDAGHQIRDTCASELRPLHEVVTRDAFIARGCVRFGGGGATTRMVCGAFFLREREDEHLVRLLRPFVHLPVHRDGARQWLTNIVEILNHETQSFGVGSQAVIDHLAHALFIHAVRERLADADQIDGQSLCRAGGHPQISEALELMQTSPQLTWTLETLADRVNMSRSAFAAKFCAVVGDPPARYLTRLRMTRAARLLVESSLSVKEIAHRLGYHAETAFSTAFKRWHHTTPMAYRRAHPRGDAFVGSGI